MTQPAIYIMANKHNGTLYTGVTRNLIQRVFQHRNGFIVGCFTNRYNCKKLVYYELFEDMINAMEREKQIKSGNRKNKLLLINTLNPTWGDLYEYICK